MPPDKELIRRASGGNLRAIYDLAVDYYHSPYGRSRNRSFDWFLKAAARGHVGAQVYVGQMLQEGDGVRKNNREAIKWLKLAADKNDSDALTTLGVSYFYGDGVERDRKKALKLYRRAAANRGDSGSAYWNIALCFYYGDVVKQNYSQAAYWFRKAARSRYCAQTRMAAYRLGESYEKGLGVKQSDRWAFYWYKRSAESVSFSFGRHALALCYLHGKGTKPDLEQAKLLLIKAAKEGYKPSQKLLAKL